MLGSGHLISGLDVATGTFALMVFSAGAAAVVVAVLFRVAAAARRRARHGGVCCGSADWSLVGALFAYALFDRLAARDRPPSAAPSRREPPN